MKENFKNLAEKFVPLWIIIILGLRYLWGMNSADNDIFFAILVLGGLLIFLFFLQHKKVFNIDRLPFGVPLAIFTLIFLFLTVVVYLLDIFT